MKTLCWMAVTAYSVYLQLPTVCGGHHLHSQPEDVSLSPFQVHLLEYLKIVAPHSVGLDSSSNCLPDEPGSFRFLIVRHRNFWIVDHLGWHYATSRKVAGSRPDEVDFF
jgi:hypothetical protein